MSIIFTKVSIFEFSEVFLVYKNLNEIYFRLNIILPIKQKKVKNFSRYVLSK